MMSKSIHTERLTLRPYRDEDATVVAELIGNLSVSRWLTRVPHPYTPQDALAFFARHNDAAPDYAVTLDEEVIGCCSTRDQLGYWYGQSFWGRGFATEAAAALVNRHFEAANAPLASGYILGNTASKRVLEKLGFAPTRLEETESVALGCRVTVQKMRLSVESWRARS